MVLSTSSACAREMRGTASRASAVTPRACRSSTSAGLDAGASIATSVAPGRSEATSASVGGLTLATTSLSQTSAASPTAAPAASYASSRNVAESPAPRSTTTS